MTENCNDNELQAARVGDRYYAAMTEWLTRRRDSIEDRRKVSALARAYRRSLNLMLRCLERLRPSARIEKKIEVNQELKRHVENGIEILHRPVGNLTTAPDET